MTSYVENNHSVKAGDIFSSMFCIPYWAGIALSEVSQSFDPHNHLSFFAEKTHFTEVKPHELNSIIFLVKIIERMRGRKSINFRPAGQSYSIRSLFFKIIKPVYYDKTYQAKGHVVEVKQTSHGQEVSLIIDFSSSTDQELIISAHVLVLLKEEYEFLSRTPKKLEYTPPYMNFSTTCKTAQEINPPTLLEHHCRLDSTKLYPLECILNMSLVSKSYYNLLTLLAAICQFSGVYVTKEPGIGAVLVEGMFSSRADISPNKEIFFQSTLKREEENSKRIIHCDETASNGNGTIFLKGKTKIQTISPEDKKKVTPFLDFCQ